MLANVPGIVPIPKRTGHGLEHGAKRTLIKSELSSAYGDRQIGSIITPDTGESIGQILSQQRCAPAPGIGPTRKGPGPARGRGVGGLELPTTRQPGIKRSLTARFRQANHPQKGPVPLLATPRFQSERASQVDNLPRRSIIPANRNVQSSFPNVFKPSMLGHEALPGLSAPPKSCRNYAFLAGTETPRKPLIFGFI
jgi:hypothetical protein